MIHGALRLSVDVIIPTHNRPEMLNRAVESVLSQTRKASRIIVVDDAPDGLEPELLRGSLGEFPPGVLVVRGPHKGASGARNRGVEESASKYIAFLDDDDYWDPTYLESMLAALEKSGADLAISWARTVGPNRSYNGGPTISGGLGYRECVARNPGVIASNMVISRRTFDVLNGFDEHLKVSNDKDLFARALLIGSAYAVVPERLVIYSQHGADRLTTRHGDSRLRSLIRYRDKHQSRLDRRGRARLELSIEYERLALARGLRFLRSGLRMLALISMVGVPEIYRSARARILRIWIAR